MIITIFVVFYAFSYNIHAQSASNLIVNAPIGSFQGSILKTRLGNDIYSFRGIRYAEAPIGRNRFKHSTPVKPHEGIFDATENGPSCPQNAEDNRVISEDCLRLNIYTPELPQSSRNGKINKDVVVYLQTGALYMFSGTYDFGPDNLLDSDILLVTINYRLGSLGFMSTGDERAPGNGGFKDQVLALRWIRDNIKNFGGNPDSVTLLGYSAGSWSVGLHTVSPMSRGLFHRAIGMSGAATAQERVPTDLKHLAIKQAELLDCPIDNEDEMFDCLYEKPAEDFAKSLPGFAVFYDKPILIWSPVVEPPGCIDDIKGPFLTGEPADLIREGKGYFVPFITGIARDELGEYVLDMAEAAENGDPSEYNDFNNRWEEFAPITFDYEQNTTKSYEVSRELRSFYLNDEPLSGENVRDFEKLYSDSITIFRTHRMERLMTKYSTAPVYKYFYDWPGCETFAEWSNGTHYGIVHQDELLILFRMAGYPPLCDNDVKTLNRMSGIITNFAKTGRPIPPNDPEFSNVNWQPNTVENPKYLKIAEELSIEDGIIYSTRMDKWEELFPLPPIENSISTENCP